MRRIDATTPKNKIRILKMVRKEINLDVKKGRFSGGFCYILERLANHNKIYYLSPYEIDLKRPPTHGKHWPFWYQQGEPKYRIASINRTIERLENQIK